MKTSILQKCLSFIHTHKTAEMLILHYGKKHLLIHDINNTIELTSKQAERLIEYSYENALVPSVGRKYYFKKP